MRTIITILLTLFTMLLYGQQQNPTKPLVRFNLETEKLQTYKGGNWVNLEFGTVDSLTYAGDTLRLYQNGSATPIAVEIVGGDGNGLPSALPAGDVTIDANQNALWLDSLRRFQVNADSTYLNGYLLPSGDPTAESLPSGSYLWLVDETGAKAGTSGTGWLHIDSLLNGYVQGSGTSGTIPIWTGANTLGNSSLTESGTVVGTSFTGAFGLAVGTDAQRPVGAVGQIRYNTTGGGVEAWNGSTSAYTYLPWATADNFTANSVLFANANGHITQDNSNFYYASDKLYLGTTSLLDIRPISGATNTAVSIGTTDTQFGDTYVAIGWSSESDWHHAVAIGPYTTASQVGTAVGYGSTAQSYGTAIGNASSANTSAVAIGGGVANGLNSIAIGESSSTSTSTAIYSVAIGSNADVSAYGTALGRNTTVGHNGSIAIGNGSRSTSANQFVAGARPGGGSSGEYFEITDVFFGSGVQRGDKTSASNSGPGVDYTIHGSGAAGTNNIGGNITIAGGKGTGTGTPGYISFSISTPGASGSTLQSLFEKARIQRDSFFLYGYGSGNITGTPAKSISITSGGKLIEVPEKWGAISTTTDASGDITVTHGMGTTPTSIQVTVTGTTPYVVTVHTIGATTFTVRFYDMTGAAVASTAVTATWHAKT